ncbi:MAG: PAAR domain-containing protein [Actinomycetota bacterium]
MPPAARVGDSTGHPGVITGPGVGNVLIGGLPTAVVGDVHTCSMPPPPAGDGPHPATPILKGSATVMVGGRPAARLGDVAGCGAAIVVGAATVEIGG